MPLKILCAGITKLEREILEAEVAAALGPRALSDPWTVSLVKIGDRFSVTLEGPERALRGKTFMTPQDRLRESIVEAVAGGAPGEPPKASRPPAAAPAPSRSTGAVAAAPGQRRERHGCSKCGKSYILIYEAEAGEPMETVPVACPRCWQIDHVAVAQTAGLNSDYRVEPVD